MDGKKYEIRISKSETNSNVQNTKFKMRLLRFARNDQGWSTDDRLQTAEDRGQRTEDGGQREYRISNKECRIMKLRLPRVSSNPSRDRTFSETTAVSIGDLLRQTDARFRSVQGRTFSTTDAGSSTLTSTSRLRVEIGVSAWFYFNVRAAEISGL